MSTCHIYPGSVNSLGSNLIESGKNLQKNVQALNDFFMTWTICYLFIK